MFSLPLPSSFLKIPNVFQLGFFSFGLKFVLRRVLRAGIFLSWEAFFAFHFYFQVFYGHSFLNHSLTHLIWVILYLRISPFSSSLNFGSAFKLWHFIFVFVAAAASACHRQTWQGRHLDATLFRGSLSHYSITQSHLHT